MIALAHHKDCLIFFSKSMRPVCKFLFGKVT
jgi:hypothetical protein